MRAKAIVTILAAAALIILVPPMSAGAAKTEHQPAQTSAELDWIGTHGFSFILFTLDRGVFFALQKASHDGFQSVLYIASERHLLSGVKDGRLDIKVGKLGHFRGHFVATSTKVQKPEAGCTGEPTIEESGHFVGSFVFHGERGYTTIQTPRMDGAISRQGAIDCRATREPGRHGHGGKAAGEATETATEEDEYRLLAGDPKTGLVFQASREQAPPDGLASTSFEANAPGRKAGAFTVRRSVSTSDTGKDAAASFLVPNLAEPLAEATVEPPAPFSGSATFHLDTPRSASWTGDLAVELPGAGKLPLTGKGLYAGACRGRSNCTATLPHRLQGLLEVGRGLGGGYFFSDKATTEPGS